MKNSTKSLDQAMVNGWCYSQFEFALFEMRKKESQIGYNWEKFRKCRAEVLKLDNYVLLRSYRTIVACINLDTLEGFDLLRCEYGYTSTSAQHISKFFNEFGVKKRYRWYYIG